MKKTTTIAIVALSASIAQGEMSYVEHRDMLPSENYAIDQITVRLTPEQKADLIKIIEMMGAEVGDWKTNSSSMAPSKCTVDSN